MKTCSHQLLRVLTFGVVLAALVARAQTSLEVVSVTEHQSVFDGGARPIEVVFHNPGHEPVKADLRCRLYQTTTATAVLTGETPWKGLQVLPGQKLVESASLEFPEVKAATCFMVQWLAGTNTVLGTTPVLVCPTDVMKDLRTLAGEKPIGVLDPLNALRPLLNAVKIDVEDLADIGLASFSGKLAILGPFHSREQMGDDIAGRVAMLARKGAAVVWIQPPPADNQKLTPTFHFVPLGDGAVVVAQAQLVADLATEPAARLNLIHLAEYAVRREPPQLPYQTP